MYLIILVTLCCSLVLAASTDNAVMVFNIDKDYKCTLSYHPILLEDEPMVIHVINSFKIDEGECSVESHKITFNEKKQYDRAFVATIYRVVNNAKPWYCSFRKKSWWIETVQCGETQFHLRTIIPVASISLNNNQIDAMRTNVSVKNYDADAQYTFEDGETVVIGCKPSSPSLSDLLMMKYSTNTDATLLETNYLVEDTNITLRLTQEAHLNHFDCIYKKTENDISVTRLVFQMQDAEVTKSNIALFINGMYVRPTGSVYKYVYNAGERTDIACELRNYDNLVLELDYNGNKKSGQSIVQITLYNNTIDISCIAKTRNTDIVQESVTVKFIESSSSFYVSGLNQGNILKQYKKTMRMSVIHYQYTDIETLKLTCTKINKNVSNKLKWMYNDNISLSSSDETDGIVVRSYLNLTLQRSNNMSSIRCIYEPTPYSSVKTTYQIIIRLTYINSSEISIPDEEITVLPESHWIWLVVTVGVVIVIVIVVTFTVKYFRNRRNKMKNRDENYVNSSSNMDSPLPHPSQWNEANYTRLKEHENDEPDYENRININKKSKTKNLLQKETSKYDANVEPALNYADIIVGNNTKMLNKTDSANYSSVQFTDTSTGGNNYVNLSMIQDPSYVNCQVSEEQAEPTYCEVLARQ